MVASREEDWMMGVKAGRKIFDCLPFCTFSLFQAMWIYYLFENKNTKEFILWFYLFEIPEKGKTSLWWKNHNGLPLAGNWEGTWEKFLGLKTVPLGLGWDLGLFTEAATCTNISLSNRTQRSYKGLKILAHMCRYKDQKPTVKLPRCQSKSRVLCMTPDTAPPVGWTDHAFSPKVP